MYIYICICPKSNSHQPPFLTVMACAKVGRRGTSIDLCLDEVAFDLTRPSAFGHRGCNMWQCVLKYIHGKGKKWCDQVIAGCSTNCSFTIFPFHIFTNQNKMFVAYSVSVDGLYLSNLRLVLNEILRCKPGSTVLMAPDCRSLSRMPLCWKRLLPMVYNLHFTASGHVDGIVDEVKLIVKS